jgi:hypothetical protein
MKKRYLYIVATLVIACIATLNISVNLNSRKSNNLADISLAKVEQLAMAEDLPEVVITCSYSSCHGKQCHQDTGNLMCPCTPNGFTYAFCLL